MPPVSPPDNEEFLVEWSIDYAFHGEGYSSGVEHCWSEEEAREFVARGKLASPPTEERVRPSVNPYCSTTVTLHHPGFTAVIYRAVPLAQAG